ncbi:MAG: hypothetical protein A2Y21_06480 [Clostridiales bacterium GWC2_40_7]|nr:MAG: hypothetical protein A2Y21_06480 [Clostridiales bacterium GWC2_40_7]
MINRKYIVLLTACLCTLIVLSACSDNTGSAVNNGKPSADKASDGRSKADILAEQEFFSAFREVKENPINSDIVYALWFASISAEEKPEETSSEDSAGSVMEELAQKYLKLVNGDGVHYIITTNSMEMSFTEERWVKNGKFKKIEPDSKRITLFDGKYWIEYRTDTKEGLRYKKDDKQVAPRIKMETEGQLTGFAAAPYQPAGEKEFNGYNCLTFFLEMEFMDMKGNTLWIDKETGIIVKNAYGKNEEMTMILTLLEKGGFGDDVFTVPSDVKIKDYKP